MLDILTLFQVSISNIDLIFEIYDLSSKEKYLLKKIKSDMEVYIHEETVNNVSSNS